MVQILFKEDLIKWKKMSYLPKNSLKDNEIY